jgi:hypothetical protein
MTFQVTAKFARSYAYAAPMERQSPGSPIAKDIAAFRSSTTTKSDRIASLSRLVKNLNDVTIRLRNYVKNVELDPLYNDETPATMNHLLEMIENPKFPLSKKVEAYIKLLALVRYDLNYKNCMLNAEERKSAIRDPEGAKIVVILLVIVIAACILGYEGSWLKAHPTETIMIGVETTIAALAYKAGKGLYECYENNQKSLKTTFSVGERGTHKPSAH